MLLTILLQNAHAQDEPHDESCYQGKTYAQLATTVCSLQTKDFIKKIKGCEKAGQLIWSILLMHSVYHNDYSCLDKLQETGLIKNKLSLQQPANPGNDEFHGPSRRPGYSNQALTASNLYPTPLGHAAYLGNLNMVKKLVSMGADLNEKVYFDIDQQTPNSLRINIAGIAALFGKTNILKYLREMNVDFYSENCVSPLILSIFSFNSKTFDLILSSNPQLELRYGTKQFSFGPNTTFEKTDTAASVVARYLYGSDDITDGSKFLASALIKLAKAGANLQVAEGVGYILIEHRSDFTNNILKNLVHAGLLDINAMSERGNVVMQTRFWEPFLVTELGANINKVGANTVGAAVVDIGTHDVESMGLQFKLGLDLNQKVRCKVSIQQPMGPMDMYSYDCDNSYPEISLLEYAIAVRDWLIYVDKRSVDYATEPLRNAEKIVNFLRLNTNVSTHN